MTCFERKGVGEVLLNFSPTWDIPKIEERPLSQTPFGLTSPNIIISLGPLANHDLTSGCKNANCTCKQSHLIIHQNLYNLYLCSCTMYALTFVLFPFHYLCLYPYMGEKNIYRPNNHRDSSKHRRTDQLPRYVSIRPPHPKTMERPGINNSPHIGTALRLRRKWCTRPPFWPWNGGSSWATARNYWTHQEVDQTMTMSLLKKAPNFAAPRKMVPFVLR